MLANSVEPLPAVALNAQQARSTPALPTALA